MEPTIGELLFSGIKLMAIGMTIVFLFLALLVWIIRTNSRLIQRYAPEPQPHFAFHAPITTSTRAESEADDAELVAVISAAIHRHQNS
ncbi:OadG family protein [Methylococcus sp. EFPC2]|uniref:OadG family protein n=1 Tax=Methylococcus sp. EFPC2 TaxID=2812648 RepID=UPI0019670E78|nr:OadG family protein [Methylococcus sp. EFPC2]QSA98949.1 OadG family protein [Methylococcus sp. EFPC2]